MSYGPKVYHKQGGDEMVVASGGSLDIESGGALKIAGVQVNATAAEPNAIAGNGLSAAELAVLDGALEANSVASKAAMLDANKRLQNDAADGTPGTGVTAVEYGDGFNHTTILTLAAVAATIGDAAALAGGALIYTFPAGALVINSVTMSVGLNLTTGTPTTDTPELGLGTVIGSGVNATLGDVGATSEDILGPGVADDIAGTAELLTKSTGLKVEAADPHTVHMNYADTWADVDDTTATLDGTVVLNWTLLPLA